MRNNIKPKVASFFSGGGGMDLGFEKAGYEIFSCMDIESWACDTLKVNHPNALIIGPPIYSGNIKKISPKEYSEITNVTVGSIDVFTGGPPCQPFSQAAAQRFLKGDERFKRKGFDDHEKGTLLFDYINYIEYFKPKVFVLENVPGLLSLDDGVQLSEALSRLRAIGYKHTEPKITEAANYGVPQYRSRLIIWGTLDAKVSPTLPERLHMGMICF
jgi:DNA (cytosine-5)-methyltransferase 1